MRSPSSKLPASSSIHLPLPQRVPLKYNMNQPVVCSGPQCSVLRSALVLQTPIKGVPFKTSTYQKCLPSVSSSSVCTSE